MKKVQFVFVFLIGSMVTGFSQVDFGVDVSMGASRIRIDNPKDQPDLFTSESGAFGFSFGPSMTIGVKDNWAIHTAIDFSFTPTVMQYNGSPTFQLDDYFSTDSEKYNSVFIEIPLSVRYHIVDRDKLVSPYLAFGAVYDYQILEGCPNTVACLDHTAENNLGGIFGFGFEIGRINLGAKAEIGLLNMITEDYLISKSDLKISKDMLLIEVGYTFQ